MQIRKGTVVWVAEKEMLGINLDEPMGIGRLKITSWEDPTFYCIEDREKLIPLFHIDPKDLKLSSDEICKKYLQKFLLAIFELLGIQQSTFKNWRDRHEEHYHTP